MQRRGPVWILVPVAALLTFAPATHVFEPGESRTITWAMRAELYAEHPGDRHGAPAPPGIYLVRAEFEMRNEDGTRPGVGAHLRVR